MKSLSRTSFGKWRSLSLIVVGFFGTLLAFQNCSRFSKSATGDGVVNLSSIGSIQVTPTAATIAPSGTIQFQASSASLSTLRYSVIGNGTIDQTKGLYTAAAASSDDIVRVTDSSGASAYSFVKVAVPGSPVGLTPAALLIGFQTTFQFIATGGTPPFSYSVSPNNLGTVDSVSGRFTSAETAGTATLLATDANGLTSSSLITIQSGASTLAPIYAPNPLSFGQVANFYISDVSGGNVLLQSGPGAANGLTYTPGYQAGPANLQLEVGNAQVDLEIPLVFVGGGGCVHGKQVFSFTGADQFFVPPANCPSLLIKAWGAGGAGGNGYPGGGGGFVTAVLAATEIQSLPPLLTIIVGQGGFAGAPGYGAYGGGGGGGPGNNNGVESGGGRSAIRVGSVEILTAGGGGGGVYGVAGSGNDGVGDQGTGGAGGGLIGSPGLGTYVGQGGTQKAGGASNGQAGAVFFGLGLPSDGSQFQGGTAGWGAGSGGGGYYGGGGGGGGYPGFSNPGLNNGGGGGGSSYIGGGAGQTLYAASTVAGNGAAAAETSDPDYVAGIGQGMGTPVGPVEMIPGGNGLVVISW